MLASDFEFSQGSLQDFVDCPRRFQLKYLMRQSWPAVEAEPLLDRESNGVLGQQFHRILERYYLLRAYLSEDEAQRVVAETVVNSDVLAGWWAAFQSDPPLNLPQDLVLPEFRLAIPFGQYRLLAVFDLLALEFGQRIVIVDWKTGHFRPSRDVVGQRLQTRVYPYVAVKGVEKLFGGVIDPARVTMVYWYVSASSDPHVYHYTRQCFEEDERFLQGLIADVAGRVESGAEWDLTLDEKLCGFCVYRSFCARGWQAEVGLDVDDGDWEAWVGGLDDVDELVY